MIRKKTGIRVGYQGEAGAFSEAAARKMLGNDIQPVPFPRFFELFRALENGNLEYAVAPIENSIAGSVVENYDLLLRFRPLILREDTLQIVHNLIAMPSARMSDITRVYSHPMALMQCREFFRKHGELLEISDYDTAGSVKRIVGEGVTNAAAIANASCAKIYGGKILKRDIGDSHENYTRFFLLAPQTSEELVPLRNKTSIVFRVKNVQGVLSNCLLALAKEGIDLAKIESRPIVGIPWKYTFYLDFMGNLTDVHVARALSAIEALSEEFYILGNYAFIKPL